jgi:predicted TIM-barrel fold metal-dependent hydrolase
MQITNCHVHTFTAEHVPDRYAGFFGQFLRIRAFRLVVLWVMRFIGHTPRSHLARYARILETSYQRDQEAIFNIVQGFYPPGTRFVILPMDMTYMKAGTLSEPLAEQHKELEQLQQGYPGLIVLFAAVDPRHPNIVASTIDLLERHGFRGIKLYPPLGYHPDDPALADLYRYASEHAIPVLSHCSRRGVLYRGKVSAAILRNRASEGESPKLSNKEKIIRLADPANFVPVLDKHPTLKLCVAHFGGDEEWAKDRKESSSSGNPDPDRSWLAKIADLIKSGRYENLYTDISYTLFADDAYVHMLKNMLADPQLRRRVLFGSDFYVVEDAKLEERKTWPRIRSVLGEDLFRVIAEENPKEYLGTAAAGSRGHSTD